MTNFPFEVAAVNEGAKIDVTVTVLVTEERKPEAILAYLRSFQLKEDLMKGWARENAPNYGLSVNGSPHPIFEKAGDRASRVEAYEQKFRFTRSV